MAEQTVGGVRVQDWIGMVMIALGVALLVWFSWGADAAVKTGAIGALAVVIVSGGYLAMRRAGADR